MRSGGEPDAEPRGCTLRSDPVRRVLCRLAEEGRLHDGAAKRAATRRRDGNGGSPLGVMERATLAREAPIAVSSELGELIYLLARGRARRIVEFGGSLGVSTIHLAAAIRDGEGDDGLLISTEIQPEKADALRENVREAGLDDLVEVRVGDALESLRDRPEKVDLLFLDGWSELYLQLLELMEPALAKDALLIAELNPDDPSLAGYLRHVRDRRHGWVSLTIPLDAGVELSMRESSG